MSILTSILDRVIGLVPEEYKWDVALKKAGYAIGKLAVAGIMYGKVGKVVGSHLTPDQLLQVQAGAAAISIAALEGIHDLAKLTWPESKWL